MSLTSTSGSGEDTLHETEQNLEQLRQELLNVDAAAAIMHLKNRLQQLQSLIAKLEDVSLSKTAALEANDSRSVNMAAAVAVAELPVAVDRVCEVTAKVASTLKLTAAENEKAKRAVSLLNGEIRRAEEALKSSSALQHDEQLQRCLRNVQNVERATVPGVTGVFSRLWQDSYCRQTRKARSQVHVEQPLIVLSVDLPSPMTPPPQVTVTPDRGFHAGDPLQQEQNQQVLTRARVKEIAERGTRGCLPTSPLPPACADRTHQLRAPSPRGLSTQESSVLGRPAARLPREASSALRAARASCSESQHLSAPLSPGASLIIRSVSPSPSSTPVRSPAPTPIPSRSPSLERRSETSLELSEKEDMDPRLEIRPRTVPPLHTAPSLKNQSLKPPGSTRPHTARLSRLGG